MALSKFKYIGGRDRGVNPDKQKIAYDIVFPLGKPVEVPDNVAAKLRTKAGRDGDEFQEVFVGADLSESDKQREAEIKAEKDNKKKEKPLTPEELEELKKLAAVEEARKEKIRTDAQLGR